MEEHSENFTSVGGLSNFANYCTKRHFFSFYHATFLIFREIPWNSETKSPPAKIVSLLYELRGFERQSLFWCFRRCSLATQKNQPYQTNGKQETDGIDF